MNCIRKKLSVIDRVTEGVLMLCLSTMGLVLFLQVLFRYILKNPLVWSEEAARYLHVWIALLGIRFGLKHDAHLRVSFFYNRLSRRKKTVVKLLTDLFILFCIVLYLPGAVLFLLDQKQIVSSAMGVNMGLVYAPAVLGFLTSMVHLLIECCRSVSSMLHLRPSPDSPAGPGMKKENDIC